MKLTLREAAALFRNAAAAYPQAMEDAVQLTVDDCLDTARDLSGGALSPADLARLDHPYAVRHGSPLLNPGVVNIGRTGQFIQSWEKADAAPDGNAVRGRVWNTSDHAGYLESGTKFMFARPLTAEVKRQVEPRFRMRIRVAFERALRP